MSGAVEHAQCDFCKQDKPVERIYLRPSKYTKPEKFEDYDKLYNQGNYFIYITTCFDCGPPKQ
jgi:hypothetical protein